MKPGWLRLADRLVRIDRVHEFWIERVESGYVIKAAIFGSQDMVVEHFSTYEEAEKILARIFSALQQESPMVDVVALKEGWWDEYEDGDDDTDLGDFWDEDLDLPW